MKITRIDYKPTVARGRTAEPNPFLDDIDAMVADFRKGKIAAATFVETGDKADVGRWFRQLTAATKEAVGPAKDATVYKTVAPKPSTPATDGVDGKTERTVTFWIDKPDGRGVKKS